MPHGRRWIRQIDQQLEGEITLALELLEKAHDEFPSDAELVELHKLAHQGLERATEAEADCRGAGAMRRRSVRARDRASEEFAAARRSADRQARALRCVRGMGSPQLKDDWRAAELLPIARSSWMRRTVLPGIFAPGARHEARRAGRPTRIASAAMQSSGDIDAAIAEVNNGLTLYPADPRLRAILDALTKESDRRRGRTSDLHAADLETLASPTPRTSEAVAPREDQTVSARTDAAPSARPRVSACPVMLDSDDLMETSGATFGTCSVSGP